MAKKKVAVIFGGKSSEHDVSNVSAAHVIRSIPKDEFEVICIGITKKGHWVRFIGSVDDIASGAWERDSDNVPCIMSPDPLHKGFILLEADGTYATLKADVVFPVLHGKNGEDGTIQGLFAMSEVPFVGCDMISSANCMDKELTHIVLGSSGVKMAKYISMRYSDISKVDEFIAKAESELTYPMFVKPCCAGSSVGVSRCTNAAELKEGIKKAFLSDRKLLIEQGVNGIECECAVMGNDDPFASAVGEIKSANVGFYDFDSKYNDASSETIIPAAISETASQRIRETAVRAYKLMGCSGLSRVDFFLCDGDEPVLNEINTLPGHTPISMYPKLMEHEGIPFEEQERRLIELALENSD
ncbi:D-alanine-D-alanine ligase [Ruminococcus sp. YE71]|uniref:D-alanine--D-alanine ligase family protein n=1 Tax=unclassified Ruminococcus TaxID=2608920 RepID=UPI0008850896|nr:MULTISPECIES: D-alanine--D-alanine ligase family protein [unclassified Ruminococcus]SDA25106.1 D-alanine-D-alanine ligase [Ruminococcus sp. YE78]SFW43008.1 D-alanine-D-alanine ligase [Ruminococcus sp. YE71]